MARLPGAYRRLQQECPEVVKAYERLGEACFDAGPLDRKVAELVKLAYALGAGSEGGVHSHARRALAAGASADALRQVALLGFTTIGFPRSMAGLTWIEDIAAKGRRT